MVRNLIEMSVGWMRNTLEWFISCLLALCFDIRISMWFLLNAIVPGASKLMNSEFHVQLS